jgi:hypothetical protein
MPLIPPAQITSVDLLARTQAAFSFLVTAASQMNQMSSDLLALDNAKLTDWLNSQTMADISKLFEAHAVSGAAVNQALATTSIQLSDSGVPSAYVPVDVRSFQDKLAAQGRKVESVDGKFIVSDVLPS